jgi:cell shape-determining protein MreC
LYIIGKEEGKGVKVSVVVTSYVPRVEAASMEEVASLYDQLEELRTKIAELESWKEEVESWKERMSQGDINLDHKVDLYDLIKVARNFGKKLE